VGSNERDLLGLAPYLDDRLLILSARAPITLGPGSYAWYRVQFTERGPVYEPGSPNASIDALQRFVAEAADEYGADPERVFVGGFSQGGGMTYSLVRTVPERLAGAVIMSGRTIAEAEERAAPPEAARGLPVLVVHGTRDGVLPIESGREIRDRLAALPVELDYREYAMAHEVGQQSLADIAAWLTEQIDRPR
jgi:phospholipase/carboxylesterase